jgi:hypothetical protein
MSTQRSNFGLAANRYKRCQGMNFLPTILAGKNRARQDKTDTNKTAAI